MATWYALWVLLQQVIKGEPIGLTKAAEGSKEDDTWYTNVLLPRPADNDMEDKSTFATQTKLLAAAKAAMGTQSIAAAEESATLVLQQKTHGTAIAPS